MYDSQSLDAGSWSMAAMVLVVRGNLTSSEFLWFVWKWLTNQASRCSGSVWPTNWQIKDSSTEEAIVSEPYRKDSVFLRW